MKLKPMRIIKKQKLMEFNLNIEEHLLQKGIFNEQVCIITAIQRFGHAIARTLNYGKPTSQRNY